MMTKENKIKAIEHLESDPFNPLAKHAAQVELSNEFLEVMFSHIDPLSKDAKADQETFKKCQQIILNRPDLFVP